MPDKSDSPQTTTLDPLVELVAREFYIRSLRRDGLTDAVHSWDEQWAMAKERYAEAPEYYIRPAHAIDDATLAVTIVKEAMKDA